MDDARLRGESSESAAVPDEQHSGKPDDDKGFSAVLDEERGHLGEPNDGEWWALCLSGGGIRSATFCLGVLQGLAAKGLLGKFHYLSTVSGGGYIGSWLSSWIARTSLDHVTESLAATPPRDRAEPREVLRLRAYSNYLSPVWGLSTDFFTLVSIFLRNLVLNWFVLVPLLAAVVLCPWAYTGVLGWEGGETACRTLAGLAALLVCWGIAYVTSDLSAENDPDSGAASTPAQNAQEAAPQPQAANGWEAGIEGRRSKDKFALFCFAPIVVAAILLGWVGIQKPAREWDGLWFVLGGVIVHSAGCVLGATLRSWRGLPAGMASGSGWDFAFIVLSGAAGGAAVWGLVWLARYVEPSAYATLAVPALVFCFWLATTLYVGLACAVTSEMDREWWARSGGWWLRACLVWLAGFTLVIYGPEWIYLVPKADQLGAQSWVAGGGLLGILTGLIGYWSHNGTRIRRRAKSLAGAIGIRVLDLAAIVFIGLLVIGASYALSAAVPALHKPVAWLHEQVAALWTAQASEADGRADGGSPVQVKTPASSGATEKTAASQARAAAQSRRAQAIAHAEDALVLFIGLLALTWLMSRFIGVNTFSLHSMYGNRLVRAYLGATNPKPEPHWFTGFDPKDNVDMARLTKDAAGRTVRKLLHVINIALNVVETSGNRLEWQQRKAVPFTVSPLHCGSPELGYVEAGAYSSKRGMSLARAMTVSGAAASPSMGYHSSAPVAFVMTLFNVRLGWWLPNPSPKYSDLWKRSEPQSNLGALFTEATAQTTLDSRYVYLSDGGHFENLGLYEMVRRRCRRIVVVDASCDWEYAFHDLQDAIRKIRVDLGVPIEFPDGLPTLERARETHCHHALGTVRYSCVHGREDGSICYIKPVLSGDEELDVAAYAAQHAGKRSAFPHQSTSDQFFNEAQFESYRALGRHSVEKGYCAEAEWFLPVPSVGARYPGQVAAGGTSTEAAVPAPTRESITTNVTRTLSSMSEGALVASAITVGGVLGVTGTVALKDSTVKLEPGAVVALAERDRDVLQKLADRGGLFTLTDSDRVAFQKLSDPGVTIGVAAEDRELLQGVVAAGRGSSQDLARIDVSVRAVADAVTELREALKPRNPPDPPIERTIANLAQQVQSLAAAVGKIEPRTVAPNPSDSGSGRADLKEINDTLKAIHATLRRQPQGSGQASNAADMLSDIIDEMRRLRTAVLQTVPTRNVRGVQEGGGR